MTRISDEEIKYNLITDDTFERRNATVLGWGYTKDGGNGSSPDLLHQAEITIMTNEKCKLESKYGKQFEVAHIAILPTMMCAANHIGIARDACSVIN